MSKPSVLNVFQHMAQLINGHRLGPRPTDCTTSPLRQVLHMHKQEQKIGRATMRKVATSTKSKTH